MRLPLRIFLWLIPFLFAALLVLFWPLPEALLSEKVQPLRFLDRHGALLYEWKREEGGRVVPLASIPESVKTAVIAIEDRRFFAHSGVSLRSILRAAFQNLRASRIVSGGSTITQQLVRIRMHPAHRSFLWKIREALLAIKLERKLRKEEILESYLNSAYFGHQAYGIAAAAEVYFGKSSSELSMAESAFLAGLLQSPSALDPFKNFAGAKERQERVLQALREEGIITPDEEEETAAEPLILTEDRVRIQAPHFVLSLLPTFAEELSFREEVRTTLDLSLQRAVERIVERHLETLAENNVSSASVVVLDAKTGDILSMVGSADYFDEENAGAVNVALSARQPGSALKPFTYALAFAAGETAASTVADVSAQFLTQEGNPYTPRNYDFSEHGLVRYREALANSYNIAAVKVLEKVGVERLLTFLRQAGISTLTEKPEHYGLALTLGAGEVTLLELTQAFGIFPRGGQTLHARALLEVSPKEGESILDPRIAWLVSDILSDETARLPEFGEGGPLSFPFPVAAKTGTTRNSRDNWTIGYSPDVLVGVWVGNADNTPMRGTSGITGAAPIFHDVMEEALKGRAERNFAKPSGIVEKEVCALSGKLPTVVCPERILESFLTGTEPKEVDDLYQELPIDTRNALRATASCPPQFVRKEIFTVFPKEVEAWARAEGFPVPPPKFSPLCNREPVPSLRSFIEITHPQPGDSFRLDPLIPDRSEKILLRARADDDSMEAEWFLDGVSIGKAEPPDFLFSLMPSVGVHLLEIRSGSAEDSVEVEVVE